jgi:ADP-ribosylglycohydrolase
MARLWDIGKSEPIKVGKASPTEGTLPGAIYFIIKYQDDMVGAFNENAMVGGDNASRSIAIGMVLGAYHGVEAIPLDLKDSLNHWKHSEKLLETLPLFACE